MSEIDDKELGLLLEAIDNYDLYAPSYRKVLKTLVKLAIDDVVIVSITKLYKMSNVSRPMVYQALEIFQDTKIIELIKKPKCKITKFILKPLEFHEIIKHYRKQREIKTKYLHE